MKKLLLTILSVCCAACANTKQDEKKPTAAAPEPAPVAASPVEPVAANPEPVATRPELSAGDEILAFVRTKLPADPLKLTGTLKVRTKTGFTKTRLPVEMKLDWGADLPTAAYRIGDQTLDITWSSERPSYTFSKAGTLPTDDILGTGLNWVDLSFSMLWWPNAELIDEAQKINRDCYVVDVPVPDSENTMRLWIEKNMGMLLEAQTLDKRKKEIRRLKIKSIKKMDGMWVAKDLEIRDKASGNKTTLQTTDLVWKNPRAANEELIEKP